MISTHISRIIRRHYAVAREVRWLLNANTSNPVEWRLSSNPSDPTQTWSGSQESDVLEALVAIQVVSRFKAEQMWIQAHQEGQPIHPEGRWQ